MVSHTNRPPSPMQIRRRAAAAVHRRRLDQLMRDAGPLPLRVPNRGETPLSIEEIAIGVELGFIRGQMVYIDGGLVTCQ